MRRCGVCRLPYRSGSRVALIEGGKVAFVVACSKCAKQGVTVVAQETAALCTCGELATRHACGRCDDKKADKAARAVVDTKPILKALKLRAKLYDAAKCGNDLELSEYSRGLSEGLEQAINFIEGGSWPKDAA